MTDHSGVMGYTDRLSAEPGDLVRLHVSTNAPSWRAELVRLRALEIPDAGVPCREEVIASVEPAEQPGIEQRSPVGSYAWTRSRPEDTLAAGLTVAVLAMPTLPGQGRQTIIGQFAAAAGSGWSLGLANPRGPIPTLASQAATSAGCRRSQRSLAISSSVSGAATIVGCSMRPS